MAYEVKEAGDWQDGRHGPRLDQFGLERLNINQCIDVPCKINSKGKVVPERGVNIKAANELFAPKVFKKKRLTTKDDEGNDLEVVRVQRVK